MEKQRINIEQHPFVVRINSGFGLDGQAFDNAKSVFFVYVRSHLISWFVFVIRIYIYVLMTALVLCSKIETESHFHSRGATFV